MVASAAPIQSALLLARLSGLRPGMRSKEMATTVSAMGTLIKNTQRQEACWTSQPPSTGPIAVVIAVKPDQVPMALLRCAAGKELLMSARLFGTRKAAP